MSTHARSRGRWLSSSTTTFHHHLGEGLIPPHIFHGSVSPHHQPASKTSNDLLVFDAGGLRTSPCHLTTHQHQKRACRCSFSMLVGSAPHHATSPPTSIENEHVVARF